MKTKLTISILLCLAVFAFVFNKEASETRRIEKSALHLQNPPAPSFNNTGGRFLFGAMDIYYNGGMNFNNYDALGYNTWHTYLDEITGEIQGKHTPKGRLANNDNLLAGVSNYSTELLSDISQINSHNNSLLLWQRPKIEWLCYGQRSDYQAESIPLNDDFWFYSFNDISGSTIEDHQFNGGKKVLYVSDNESGPGAKYVLKRLKANTEQCRPGGVWTGDEECTWLIKPRIRIDSTLADNSANFNTPVCSLTVKNDAGNTIKNVILRVRHFVDNFGNYDGRYLEEYRYEAGDDMLKITGAWGSKWWYNARGTSPAGEESSLPNKADIQVYWYGNCNMWIDYVRVDNDVADRLLKSGGDQEYLTWLQQEVDNIAEVANNDAIYKFYIEHFEFNNIPCIAYVNERLKYHSGNTIDLMTSFVDRPMGGHLRWGQHQASHTTEYIYENIIQRAGFTQMFFESYPLTSKYVLNVTNQNQTFSRIPNTLPRTNGDSILAWAISPSAYDEWLQDNMDYKPYGLTVVPPEGGSGSGQSPCDPGELPQDKGNFSFFMKLANELQRDYGVPFIVLAQGHLWFNQNEVRREPTNEELDMFANLHVSYGSKGLIYFSQPSWVYPQQCPFFSKGIEEGAGLREQNVYQQDKYKWHTVRDIGARMKIWEQYVMNFDDNFTKSYIYRLERQNLISQTYFKDVAAYKKPFGPPVVCSTPDFPDTTDAQPPQYLRADCYEDTYLQMGVFKKSTDDGNKYFMVVNRRCSPHVNETTTEDNFGGKRFIRVFFDRNHVDFTGYNNWSIYDLGTNPPAYAGTFNKTAYNPFVDLAWFSPGEGRLYKIVPVMN